ncbi:MAG: hypothetical protein GVY13_11520, partial [Alphaproteobacteria bacterium]|nr:hypothetical protein [Alphaproteobacteria bacterium]
MAVPMRPGFVAEAARLTLPHLAILLVAIAVLFAAGAPVRAQEADAGGGFDITAV